MPSKIVFDFDKTLISKNSFPLWVKYIWWQAIKKGRLRLVFRITSLVVARKLIKTIDHRAFKAKLMEMSIPSCWNNDFSGTLLRFVNSNVKLELMKHIQRKDVVVVSSAAPESYLKLVVRRIVDGDVDNLLVVGASVQCGEINENYRSTKLSNLHARKIIDSAEWLDALYTDSWDDCHLAEISKKIILVDPDEFSFKQYTCAGSVKDRVVRDFIS